MHVALVGAEFEENLAIRYLWGALERAGHRVTFVVFNEAEDLERAASELADTGAPVAGLSMVFTYRARQFAELAARARELGFTGHLVAGGHFAAFHAEQLLGVLAALDSVVCGEGEEILCALVDRLAQPLEPHGTESSAKPTTDEPVAPTTKASAPANLSGVHGLVWRNGGTIERNRSAAKPADLDTLARPPRKKPLDDYLGFGVTNILSSRGCSYSCAFCSIAAWHRECGGDRLRLRAVDAVADEMSDLFQSGARIFNFHDDNFFPPDPEERRRRVAELRAALEQRGVREIAFAVKSRPDTVDEELFAELRAMGLFRVFLGLEAGTAESLRQLGRRQTVTDNVRALEVLNRLDIHTCFNLLLLNPDSTLEDLAGNVAFLRRHPHNPMNFCRTEIYTGTPLERRLAQQDRLEGDYWGYDYTIADGRAQAAFEIIFPCFEHRNYADDGLHHLAMQVDYEHQLLAHFFGRRPGLRKRVKRFLADVNLNTADHLEAIIAAIGFDAAPSTTARRALIDRYRRQVLADDRRLGRDGNQLLVEIQQAAREPAASRLWRNAAAAAGIAASLTVAAACKDTSHPKEMVPVPTEPQPEPTHPREMAPHPIDESDGGFGDIIVPVEEDAGALPPIDPTHMREMVAEPPVPPPPPDGTPETFTAAPRSLLPPEIVDRALAILARYVTPPQDVELELWFDRRGTIARIALRGHRLDAIVERNVGQEIAALSTSDTLVRNRKFTLAFSAAELRAGQALPPTHPRERVPPPPPPPTTHPMEPAPRPPTHSRERIPLPPPPPPKKKH